MFAPSFPSYWTPEPMWHKVHPIHLVQAVCNSRTVLNCVEVRDSVPTEETYCSTCAARERFVAAVERL